MWVFFIGFQTLKICIGFTYHMFEVLINFVSIHILSINIVLNTTLPIITLINVSIRFLTLGINKL